jgi:ATP-binding cassette subfamily G (WHITE) protein 2
MELIIEPQILFLDEPTTGLDAFTAVTVTQLLKNLTQNTERIIIMSVHQPRYSIYKQFDTVSLLSRGRMVYHGLTSDVLEYFGSLGMSRVMYL